MTCQCTTVAALLALTTIASVGSAEDTIQIDLGRGPVNVRIPDVYDPTEPMPLIMTLHGYSANGPWMESYVGLRNYAEQYGFISVSPSGLQDLWGLNYWNGTDACCDFFGSTDDSGYLREMIEEIQAVLNVDDRRIWLVGHSNGGFMTYRMACDHADLVAAAVSIAGMTHLDPADCEPAEPVHVLQIHGSQDTTILPGGGCITGAGCYPSVEQTLAQWRDFNGCSDDEVIDPDQLDLIQNVAGAETIVHRYEQDCTSGGSVRYWNMVNGGHTPTWTSQFRTELLDYLYAHPKPAACLADWNGDGGAQTDDFLAYLNDYVAVLQGGDPSYGDPDIAEPIGVLNTSDFLAFLNIFNTGC